MESFPMQFEGIVKIQVYYRKYKERDEDEYGNWHERYYKVSVWLFVMAILGSDGAI